MRRDMQTPGTSKPETSPREARRARVSQSSKGNQAEPHAADKAQRTLIITGRMWCSCPVSSKTMTEVEIVWVTLPAIAAAPTTAYPPGTIPPMNPEAHAVAFAISTAASSGKLASMISPKSLPIPAPSTNTGTNTPAGIGRDAASGTTANLTKMKTSKLKKTLPEETNWSYHRIASTNQQQLRNRLSTTHARVGW